MRNQLHSRFIFFLCGIFIASGAIAGARLNVTARLAPDANIQNFFLPNFNPEGYKTWTLRGLEGRVLENQTIQVKGAILQTFSGEESLTLRSTLECPMATILHEEERAYSDDVILMQGPSFILIGNKWEWDGKRHTVTVQEDVRVTFQESIDNVLKQ